MNTTVIQFGIHSTNFHPYVEERVVSSRVGQVYEDKAELFNERASSVDILLSFYEKATKLVGEAVEESKNKYPELIK
jgi:hypothetical protein